jgi:hypothetical protein
MGKVFKQILDAQRKAAEAPPPPTSPTPRTVAKRTRR